MIHITYDPVTIHGRVLPDHRIQEYIDDIIKIHNEHDGDVMITVGSELVIMGFRAAAAKGNLDHNELVFHYNNYDIVVNENGRADNYPNGFCSTFDGYLNDLIDWS